MKADCCRDCCKILAKQRSIMCIMFSLAKKTLFCATLHLHVYMFMCILLTEDDPGVFGWAWDEINCSYWAFKVENCWADRRFNCRKKNNLNR